MLAHFRRDFAFAGAITANGEATVNTTSATTITNPNIVSVSQFSNSARQHDEKDHAAKGMQNIAPWPDVMAERLQKRTLHIESIQAAIINRVQALMTE